MVTKTVALPVVEQSTSNTESNTIVVYAGQLFESKRKKFLKNACIEIDTKTGLVKKVSQYKGTSGKLPTGHIDLRDKTVLPGFVDVHTHVFLHAYKETPSINQGRDEGIIQRTIRATNNCRLALKAGYTTYRDLGTEGAHDADIGVRDAINRGLIPGPRLFVATEPLCSTGGYEIRQENRLGGTIVPRLSDPCDGVAGVRAGVRRRLGAGADVVKFYADYRKRTLRYPPESYPGALPIKHAPAVRGFNGQRNPNLLLFQQDEMDEIVREAKAAHCPVAAHACTPEAVIMAAKAGVTTIEHGYVPTDENALKAMKDNDCIFVPTLSVVDVFRDVLEDGDFDKTLKYVKKAFDMGVRIATGGDTGAFPHGENAKEMELLVEAGISVVDVLTMATYGGWEACGGEWCSHLFGSVEEGWSADLVALEGDPTEDIAYLRKVSWVMKDGAVVVEDGKILQGQ